MPLSWPKSPRTPLESTQRWDLSTDLKRAKSQQLLPSCRISNSTALRSHRRGMSSRTKARPGHNHQSRKWVSFPPCLSSKTISLALTKPSKCSGRVIMPRRLREIGKTLQDNSLIWMIMQLSTASTLKVTPEWTRKRMSLSCSASSILRSCP